jgi:hypothetical protein
MRENENDFYQLVEIASNSEIAQPFSTLVKGNFESDPKEAT